MRLTVHAVLCKEGMKLSNENKMQNLYLKNILNAKLPVSFYWMDKNGVVLGCNEEQARMFGFPSSKEFIGKSTYDLRDLLGWSDDMCEAIRQNDFLVMETGEAIVAEEILNIKGKNHTYLSHKSPLIDDDGEIIGVFGFSSDITERKEAEIEFMGHMSRDIRMLLEGIISMADQIDRVSLEKITQECAKDIHQSGRELLNVLNEYVKKMQLEKNIQLKKNQKIIHALLVDNLLLSSTVVTHLLKQEGFEVVIAKTASEALERANQQRFDFILVDMDLPEGNDVVTVIRQNSKNFNAQTHIVALTTHADPTKKAACLEMGVHNVIDKPLNSEKIKLFINKNDSVINLETLAQTMGGNTALAKEMLDMLMKELPKFKQDISAAFEQQDWEALKHHVHKLHGGVCYCGALQLKDMTGHFEKQLINKTGHYEQAYQMLLNEIDKTLLAYYK
jgi:PAS domain S-box-containing protein